MRAETIAITNIDYLDEKLMKDGELVPVSSEYLKTVPQNDIALWCYRNGVYCLPTTELIDWLKERIEGKVAVEIGSGNGAIGRALGIRMTDKKTMAIPEIASYYKALGQPVTKYPEDVETIDAIGAIKKYRPDVVIGAWITQLWKKGEDQGSVYGVDDELLIRSVKEYIHIGNSTIHGKKRAYKIPHVNHSLPFLYSRSMAADKNHITIWS